MKIVFVALLVLPAVFAQQMPQMPEMNEEENMHLPAMPDMAEMQSKYQLYGMNPGMAPPQKGGSDQYKKQLGQMKDMFSVQAAWERLSSELNFERASQIQLQLDQLDIQAAGSDPVKAADAQEAFMSDQAGHVFQMNQRASFEAFLRQQQLNQAKNLRQSLPASE